MQEGGERDLLVSQRISAPNRGLACYFSLLYAGIPSSVTPNGTVYIPTLMGCQLIPNRVYVPSAMALNHSEHAIPAGNHYSYMEYALEQARLSPPAPTKFCVGAVLVDATRNEVLSTGYSMELPGDRPGDPGNTHAEQCCFIKVAENYSLPEDRIAEVLPENTVLYTTMEPCNKRLSGNRTCVDRILALDGAIKAVYVGIPEPEVFIGENVGRKRLEDAGIPLIIVEGMQDRVLEVSTAGHQRK